MDQAYLRFLGKGNSDRIVEGLLEQQFLRPHQSVVDAVSVVAERLGVCPEAGRIALESLRIDRESSVGRLRRTELMQLGRVIHRYWSQSVVDGSPASYPA